MQFIYKIYSLCLQQDSKSKTYHFTRFSDYFLTNCFTSDIHDIQTDWVWVKHVVGHVNSNVLRVWGQHVMSHVNSNVSDLKVEHMISHVNSNVTNKNKKNKKVVGFSIPCWPNFEKRHTQLCPIIMWHMVMVICHCNWTKYTYWCQKQLGTWKRNKLIYPWSHIMLIIIVTIISYQDVHTYTYIDILT